MATTRFQEVLIAFGKGKQTNIATAQAAGVMWRLGTKLNATLADPKLTVEDDAPEYGKGHEFATQTFTTAWNTNVSFEKYLSAEVAAWAMCFGLGKQVKSGTTPNFIYTCTPAIPSAGDSAELPYFSYVEQIRPGASVVLDRLMIGQAVESWQIAVASGPGRANSKITVEIFGSGKITDSSTGITMPALTVEKLLPSASAAVTIIGVDYVTTLKNLISLDTGWKNNIRDAEGFFPGSGFQTSGDATTGAIRGRLEFGNREGNLKFRCRMDASSAEYTKLKAQTTGTAVISLTYDTNNSLLLTWQKVAFKMVTISETNQLATVDVECTPEYHATNGILTAVAKVAVDAICE